MKGVIFDFDGTLVDSMGYWRKTLGDYTMGENLCLTEEELNSINKMSFDDGVNYLRTHYNIRDNKEEVLEKINNIMKKYYINEVSCKPYVVEFLDYLKNNQVQMCIATATKQEVVECAIEHIGISHYFKFVASSYDTKLYKNKNAKLYEYALERLGTDKDKTYVAEDLWIGLKFAKEAGFKTIGVFDSSYQSSNDKVRLYSDVYIDNYKDFKI